MPRGAGSCRLVVEFSPKSLVNRTPLKGALVAFPSDLYHNGRDHEEPHSDFPQRRRDEQHMITVPEVFSLGHLEW